MVWTGTLFFGTLTKALNVAFGGFLLTYRFVPTRRPSWQAAFAGALIASAAFMVAKPVFLGYVQVLALDNFLYGSLGGIAAVIWAWVVSMIGIFGGQVASIWQAVMVEGESLDTVKRRHLPDLKRPFDQFEQRVAA